MRARWIILVGITLLGLGYFLVSSSMEEAPASQHGEAPSLDCFNCHGPHPPESAWEINLPSFELPPHGLSLDPPPEEPILTCSDCHEYPEDIAGISPNSCVGCHARGGYSVKAALEALIEAGHPDVISMIKTVPSDCLLCHQENLGPLMHQRHLFESPRFVIHFHDGCVRCHPLEENGESRIENHPLE